MPYHMQILAFLVTFDHEVFQMFLIWSSLEKLSFGKELNLGPYSSIHFC